MEKRKRNRVAQDLVKARWFTTEDHTTMIHCPPDRLEEFLVGLFKGDRVSARDVRGKMRPVTLAEYAKYELYEE